MACFGEEEALEGIGDAPRSSNDLDLRIPQTIGKSSSDAREEGGHAQQSVQAEEPTVSRKRLKKMKGRSYMNLPPSRVYQPLAIGALVFYMYAQSLLLFLPKPVAKYLRLFHIVSYFAESIIFARITAIAGVGPRWLCLLQILLCMLAGCVARILTDQKTFGYLLVCFLMAVVGARFWRQPCFGLVSHVVVLPVMIGFFFVFSSLPRVLALIKLKWFEIALFPVANVVVGSLFPRLLMKAVERTACPGLNPYCMAEAYAFIKCAAEALRLAGFLQSTTDGMAFLQMMCMGVTVDVISRFPLKQYACERLKSECRIPPSRDLVLRMRFSLSYMAFLPGLFVISSAALAGAPWARARGPWVALLGYGLSSMISDAAIVALHRWSYPVSGEPVRATLARLTTQPRSHWPTRQTQDVMLSQGLLWSPSCMHRPPYLTDGFWHAFVAQVWGYISAGSIISAIYGSCYVWWQPSCDGGEMD